MKKAKSKAKVKDPSAVALSAMRMTKMTARRRKEIARAAIKARWDRVRHSRRRRTAPPDWR